MRRLAQKKKCLQHRALIVAWLRVNYCLQASGSIAKRDVFVHYIELCRANRIQPSSAASFGKILKMAFPTVKCNRVGPRGASKHHYRGLVLRDAYQLSLENVEPISDAAIAEMMKNMEDNDNNDDDDDDDDDANGGDAHSAIKSESSTSTYASPTQQYQQPPHGYLSSSSPTPSPPPNHHYNGYAAAQFMPPPAAYAAYPPLPPALSAAIKPAYTLPPPSQPQHAHYMPPHDAKKAESFSWISPDMQESRSTASALQPPSQAAYREWAEKRDLVEFCERNFQSLYDTILRFNCGEGKDQVLTHVAEAWKNLRQYTQHMNLFPETPTSSSTAVVAKAEQAGGTGDYAQGEGKRNQDERYTQLGNDHDELKRKAMLDVGYSSTLPHHQQQFHQPLSAYQHNHHQQSGQQQHNSKRPYTSSPPQSSQGGIDHYATAAPPALPPPSSSSTTTGSTPPLVSFSGSSSSVSLSWLNSLAFSVNNPQYQQSQPNPYTYTSYHRTAAAGGAGSNAAAAASSYQLPAFAASAEGNRGSLEGLEYRSFEWKGAFE